MKLHHFHEIVAIAERGSIRAAARHLGIAQSALTRSLAELEREFGGALFERRARGVAPPQLGQSFVRNGTLVLNQIRRTRDEIDQIRNHATGAVTVGLSIAAHLALLPASLRPFAARYPDVRLNVIEGFYPTLEAGLRDGSVDFYIGPHQDGKILPELSREPLFGGRRIVLCRAGHPLARARSLHDIAGADWISTSITATAEDEIVEIFLALGLPAPRVAVRCQSALSLITCLLNTDLLAMVPMQWNEFALTRGTLTTIDIAQTLAAPPIVLIKRIDLPLPPATTYLLDLLRRAQAHIHARPGRSA